MKLVNGCIVTFRTKGMQYREGSIPREVTGKVARVDGDMVYVSTGMALWLVPIGFIVNVRAPKPKVITVAAVVQEGA